MQPRTLQQILAESNAVYDPQVASVQKQISDLPGQLASDEQALKAQEQDYYDNTIMADARRRGIGFAGIPIGDRARYGATSYLPALANLRTANQQRATSLQDAILGIRERQNQYAQGVYQTEQDRAFQERQANAQLAAQRAQAAAYADMFKQSQTPAAPASAPDKYANIDKAGAQNAILGLLQTNDPATINRTLSAIKASASYGNLYDQYKLELIDSILAGNNTGAFNSSYASLLKKAQSYKAPAAAKKPANNSVIQPPTSIFSTSNPILRLLLG